MNIEAILKNNVRILLRMKRKRKEKVRDPNNTLMKRFRAERAKNISFN